MWFEDKWMELEDIMLSEISQVQKDKGRMFSLICGRQIQNITICTKTNMIIYTSHVIVEIHYGAWGRRERKRE
jgi:hypothetical protein